MQNLQCLESLPMGVEVIVSPCPICLGISAPFASASALKLRHCSGCSTVYLSTAPQSLKDYAQEIEKQYFGSEFAEKSGTWMELYERWNNQRTLKRLPAPVQFENPTLLEIGIGSGSFLQAATLLGWQAVGIEASPEVAAHVQRKFGVSVFTGTIEEYDQRLGEKFDVIVMNHVLEHMPDPIKALQQVGAMLKPTGVLHLAVPNFDSWEARFRGWISYQPYHLFYFGRDSLTYALQQSRYKIIAVQSHETFSGWVNTFIHTVKATRHRLPPEPIHSSSTTTTGTKRNLARNGFEVIRLATGGLLWPLRLLQAALGKGEDLIVLAGREDLTERVKESLE